MARPRKPIDEKLVFQLAQIHCTVDEIAHLTGVSVATIQRRFATPMAKARSEGKISLRRAMWKSALEKGNFKAQQWLSKQSDILGMKEPRDPVADATVTAIVAGTKAAKSEVKQAVETVRAIADEVARFHRQ